MKVSKKKKKKKKKKEQTCFNGQLKSMFSRLSLLRLGQQCFNNIYDLFQDKVPDNLKPT